MMAVRALMMVRRVATDRMDETFRPPLFSSTQPFIIGPIQSNNGEVKGPAFFSYIPLRTPPPSEKQASVETARDLTPPPAEQNRSPHARARRVGPLLRAARAGEGGR